MGLTTSPSGGGAGDVSAAGNNSFTGINSFAGSEVSPANAMGALAIDVTKGLNTKTISADSVFTFSGTPATAETVFSLEVTNSAGAAKTLTIPSCFSMAQQGTITSVAIPANGVLLLQWVYDGSVYKLYGDPPLTIGTGSFLLASAGIKPPGFTADGAGSALTTGKRKGFSTCPIKGTITGWSIGLDAGTATVKVWKIATGTAVPTIANVINTSGVAISTGTYVRSATVTDFTSTAVAAGDVFAFDLTAVATATELTFQLEITPTA